MTISGRSHGSTKMELKHAIRSFYDVQLFKN